ncbi:MAG: DUF5067 domain-containing protein [Eubacterium sp.]|nr:DUF5067 domain-containing protein [Eubacterium sp.]
MKRIILIISILALFLSGCSSNKPINTMKFVKGDIGTYQLGEASADVVYVYTEYTNSSGVPAVPADFMDVSAYQNDTELEQLFFSRERINDYVQCNKVVLIGETVPVVWIFERIDDSPVTVEMDTGKGTEKFTLKQTS